MTDERTDRQRKADDALDDAVREVIAAYDDAPPTESWDSSESGVVTHWITLVNSVGHDERGGFSTTSGCSTAPSSGSTGTTSRPTDHA